MKKEILFLAPYPNNHNIKDGMVQRVKAIDKKFSNIERIYLWLSFFHHKRRATFQPTDKIQVLKRNVFLHFFKIFFILKKFDIIYCHSIYNILPIIFFLPFLKAKIILDIHGVVADELYLEKKYFKSTIYRITEKIAFNRINIAIGVTKSMCSYFKKKYPLYAGEFVIYNIFPESLIKCFEKDIIIPTDIIIIYSGNTQKWQNIDLMMQTIKDNQHENFKYIILSGEVEKFKKLFAEYNIATDNIQIKSVLPNELGNYYSIASYGFILRDDSIINQVANPTKLIEYLAYGIIPIVLNEKIGDYVDYNYEFIRYEKISEKLLPQKSIQNMTISQLLYKTNLDMDIQKRILG